METKIIYTNQIQLSMQAIDFSMQLNTTFPDGTVQNQAVVYMSPQHAKGLVNVLADHVKTYEELFGTINLEANADKASELQARGVMSVPEERK